MALIPASPEDAFIKNQGKGNSKILPEDLDPEEKSVQEQYAPMSFEVEGFKVACPMVNDTLRGGNRIVAHKRPYRQGAKLDNTGAEPRQWEMDLVFDNSIQEPGVNEINQNTPLYPDVLQRFQWVAQLHPTGDLIVPADGLVRAKLVQFQRVHNDYIDQARVQAVFMEDNEDRIDATEFSIPGVSGSLKGLSEGVQFVAEAEGVWCADVMTLKESCAAIESMLRAPDEFVRSIEMQVRTARRAISSVMRAAIDRTRSLTSTETVLGPPRRIFGELAKLSDVVGYASERAVDAGSETAWVTETEETSVFAMAAKYKQPAAKIEELNEFRIDDPFLVLPGRYRVLRNYP